MLLTQYGRRPSPPCVHMLCLQSDLGILPDGSIQRIDDLYPDFLLALDNFVLTTSPIKSRPDVERIVALASNDQEVLKKVCSPACMRARGL